MVKHFRTPHVLSMNVSKEESCGSESNGKENECWKFLSVNLIVAVAPDHDHDDMMWFIQITEKQFIAGKNYVDNFWHKVVESLRFLNKGHFWVKDLPERKYSLFKFSKTFFYKDSIFYFVDMLDCKNGVKITNEHYAHILSYIELNGYAKVL